MIAEETYLQGFLTLHYGFFVPKTRVKYAGYRSRERDLLYLLFH